MYKSLKVHLGARPRPDNEHTNKLKTYIHLRKCLILYMTTRTSLNLIITEVLDFTALIGNICNVLTFS